MIDLDQRSDPSERTFERARHTPRRWPKGCCSRRLLVIIDARRAEALTSRLLAEASAQRAKLVILDIAGVSMIGTAVARGLLNTAQVLRLLGCAVTISGISPEVAMTMVGLGIGLENVATARSPCEALARYFVDERRVMLDAWCFSHIKHQASQGGDHVRRRSLQIR
jgi:anti-anti-sigma regulatory factor